MNNKIIIVAGDPNSINSEIIYKAWKKIDNKIKKRLYLIANYNLICKQYRKLDYKINIIKINDIKDNIVSTVLKIIDIPINFKNPFKVSFSASSKYVIKSLNLAHSLAIKKEIKAIINCPVNKNLIKVSKSIGVTEFFASKCKIKKSSEVMLIHNNKFSVVPLTTHLNIKDVSKNITSSLIIKKLTTLNNEFKKVFKIKPKIGVLGLNPHNGELNNKSEEVQKIIPAISKLKKAGLNIYGPLIADTTFVSNYKKYNVVVGMYHDQVLAPFKTLYHFNAINITLGLNYLRASPDHGPAIDLVGKNKANYLSLFQCIKFINNIKQ
ncbi:4-hydroxythreonine-4-phosphate dehydrogenase PdxA [Pelagibacterales bacterium SAG-MED05]|nr:4-hydroxythreonine-4-phosphate dehydrogenase PdxA [Pelagibacterales bacterium SAG-MED05]